MKWIRWANLVGDEISMREKNKLMENRYFSLYRKWERGDFLHICFESPGCSYRKQGYCIMCDYGCGSEITAEQALNALESIFQQHTEHVSNMLLGTCGSILDENEISRIVLMTILGYLRVKPIDRIILETHYLTVSDEVLDFIVKQLSGKRIAIEMGLESGNQMVLDNILQKKIDLVDLSKVMQKIKSYGIDIILNVFLGIPGFTPKQQVEDAKMAIQWAYAHGADEVVIFPANIKPGTRLWKLYEQGFYQPISHWMLIELLNNLDDQQLNTVGVSWY